MSPRTPFGSATRDRQVGKLARAIVLTVREHRRAFTSDDALRAGFNASEAARFWDDAMVEARRIEPGIDEMAVQS